MPPPPWYTFPPIYSQLEILEFEEPEVLYEELRAIRRDSVDIGDATTVLCTVQHAKVCLFGQRVVLLLSLIFM